MSQDLISVNLGSGDPVWLPLAARLGDFFMLSREQARLTGVSSPGQDLPSVPVAGHGADAVPVVTKRRG